MPARALVVLREVLGGRGDDGVAADLASASGPGAIVAVRAVIDAEADAPAETLPLLPVLPPP